MRLVVVGNGMVGHRLVAALRDRDPGGTWEITVLAEEGRPAYDRVRLSAWFDGEALDLPAVDGVAVRLGEPALTLDPAGRKVFTRGAAYLSDYVFDGKFIDESLGATLLALLPLTAGIAPVILALLAVALFFLAPSARILVPFLVIPAAAAARPLALSRALRILL